MWIVYILRSVHHPEQRWPLYLLTGREISPQRALRGTERGAGRDTEPARRSLGEGGTGIFSMAWKTGENFFHGVENPENRRDSRGPGANMLQYKGPFIS